MIKLRENKESRKIQLLLKFQYILSWIVAKTPDTNNYLAKTPDRSSYQRTTNYNKRKGTFPHTAAKDFVLFIL